MMTTVVTTSNKRSTETDTQLLAATPLLLPDGRIQTVNYSDNGDGIIQDVTYEGVPSYGPAVVAPVAHRAVVAHPVVHAVAHPVAHAVAHPVVVGHPVAHAIAHPVFHG